MNIYLWVILSIAGLYSLVILLVYAIQDSLVYRPSVVITQTPETINLPYENINYSTKDGERLNGWFIPAEEGRYTILFCHGNANNISGRLQTIQLFNRMGFNFFIFDYRGYGKSSGNPSEEGTYLDALGAWNHLVNEKNIPPENIIVMGRSLGGAIAAWLAKEKKPAGLILESTFTSSTDVARQVYPYLPVSLLLKHRYPASEYLRNLPIPKLIAHSPDDQVVPYSFGQELYNLASEPKNFLKLEGSHSGGFLETGLKYRRAIKRFVKDLQISH